MLFTSTPTLAADSSTYVYFVMDTYLASGCTGSPLIFDQLMYINECNSQSNGELKWVSATETEAVVYAYKTPAGKQGCDPEFELTRTTIQYGSCVLLPAQPQTVYVKIRRVVLNPDANPPVHFTSTQWTAVACKYAPIGKHPSRTPIYNPGAPYSPRVLMTVTDSTGANPPTGICNTHTCNGNVVCWAWKSSINSGNMLSVNTCSNGQQSTIGTSCAASGAVCGTHPLNGTCVTPIGQPFTITGYQSRFELISSNPQGSQTTEPNYANKILKCTIGVYAILLTFFYLF